MSQSLLDLLLAPTKATPDRIYGVVVGIVTNNDDPEKMAGSSCVSLAVGYRRELVGPHRRADGWQRSGRLFPARSGRRSAGGLRARRCPLPYVLGALWNGQDAPPESAPRDGDGKVVRRIIRSRAGHVIRLDDTGGSEKIEIIDKTEKNSIVIDASANTITVKADGDIILESAQGKVIIKGQSIEIRSTAQDVKIESSANMDLKASVQSNIKGSVVNIN